MNYYDIVNAITHGEKIYDLPLRVTYYCRVSTDSDVQLNSLDNQLEYYENYIRSKENWTFVDGYIEEGITGTRADKRPSFMRMIKDAKLNKFNLIITKDVSRFARDLEDSIHYIRDLKSSGVGVFFENQALNTFDPNSELVLNMLFNIAQEESKKISTSVKFGYRKAIDKGHVLGSSNITGYRKDNCKLVIVPEEAKLVKRIFELYATGEYGFHKLAKKLFDDGFVNKKGRIFDKDTLKRMIQNPKYKGFYRARTFEILDYRTKKRKKNDIEDQIIYKCEDGSVPAIVSEELWDKANEILNVRTKGYENNNYWSGGVKYPFSSKIYCKEHNVSYQRMTNKRKKTKPRWACGNYIKYRLGACESPIIAEMDLNNIFVSLMEQVFNNKNEIIKEMLDYYSNLKIDNNYQYEISNIKKEIKSIESKKEKLLELNIDGSINNFEFKERNDKYNDEISSLNIKISKIEQDRKLMLDSFSNIKMIADAIKKQVDYKNNVNEFVDKFLEEIIVYKEDNDRHKLILKIYLNLLKKTIPTGTGARHINDDNSMPIFYKKVETLDLGRSDFQRNSFKINVYLSYDID